MVAERPKDPDPRCLLAAALAARGEYKEARAELLGALALKRDHAPAHGLMGVVLDSLGLHGDAVEHHREAIRLDPGRAAWRNNYGFSLYLQGRFAEAAEAFREALRIDPDLTKARNNLGFAYGRAGDMHSAIGEFRRAGDEAEACNNLGLAYELAGDRARALDLYTRAAEADPELHSARRNLARLVGEEAQPPDAPAGEDGR
jgi:Flp pilus assembly protein TadD